MRRPAWWSYLLYVPWWLCCIFLYVVSLIILPWWAWKYHDPGTRLEAYWNEVVKEGGMALLVPPRDWPGSYTEEWS
jgi:hypothetical protein